MERGMEKGMERGMGNVRRKKTKKKKKKKRMMMKGKLDRDVVLGDGVEKRWDL